ncbi:hypothetical protein [Duganella sp. Leaf126]|uniref:hypothetical protein n=1 Tax=Duganella sp. Leaf126 TaxID=1736266 RepID=UPI000B2F34FB|nr:hypothetical protein [Duganella sp. Leaf126]
MTEPNDDEDDSGEDDGPKFGRLLLVLAAVVLLCGVLTWVMSSVFPDFPNVS